MHYLVKLENQCIGYLYWKKSEEKVEKNLVARRGM